MGQTEDQDEDTVTAGATGARPPLKKKDKDKDKDKGKKGARDRVLVFDEELGRTVVQRSRKPGRGGDFLDDLEEE
jgi:hypothetical protein